MFYPYGIQNGIPDPLKNPGEFLILFHSFLSITCGLPYIISRLMRDPSSTFIGHQPLKKIVEVKWKKERFTSKLSFFRSNFLGRQRGVRKMSLDLKDLRFRKVHYFGVSFGLFSIGP